MESYYCSLALGAVLNGRGKGGLGGFPCQLYIYWVAIHIVAGKINIKATVEAGKVARD